MNLILVESYEQKEKRAHFKRIQQQNWVLKDEGNVEARKFQPEEQEIHTSSWEREAAGAPI